MHLQPATCTWALLLCFFLCAVPYGTYRAARLAYFAAALQLRGPCSLLLLLLAQHRGQTFFGSSR